MAEHKIAVFLGLHRQQLRIEGGEMATGIDINDGEGIVHVGALDAAVALGQLAETLELPQAQILGPFLPELPEARQEGGVEGLGLGPAEAGGGIFALGLLHVESHIANAVIHKKGEQGVGVVQRFLGEDADHLEMDAATLQGGQAPHRGGMAAQAGAGAAVPIVQKGGAIQADTDMDLMALETIAPGVIDHHGVGLHRLVDAQWRP